MLEKERISIQKFKDYIRIPTKYTNVDYEKCIDFLTNYAKELSLPITVDVRTDMKPIVTITWEGENPELPSILLTSHMDVAPVHMDQWTHDPFGAETDKNGNIYGRGAQCAKSVGVQYLEAIRRLKDDKGQLLRTVYVVFVPNRHNSWDWTNWKNEFVGTNKKNVGIAFALTEGQPSSDDRYLYFNTELSTWKVEYEISCPGLTGNKELINLSNPLKGLCKWCEAKMKALDENSIFSITTYVNISTLDSGGVELDILPSVLSIEVGGRIAATLDTGELEESLKTWCQENGNGMTIEREKSYVDLIMSDQDQSCPYMLAFKKALNNKNLESKRKMLSPTSDGRYLREADVQAIGFSPIVNTRILVKSYDEYLNSRVFLNGIEIYYDIILGVANPPEPPEE